MYQAKYFFFKPGLAGYWTWAACSLLLLCFITQHSLGDQCSSRNFRADGYYTRHFKTWTVEYIKLLPYFWCILCFAFNNFLLIFHSWEYTGSLKLQFRGKDKQRPTCILFVVYLPFLDKCDMKCCMQVLKPGNDTIFVVVWETENANPKFKKKWCLLCLFWPC